MGWFSSTKAAALPWTNVSSVEQLNEIILSVSDKPKLFFKHSTRCGVSRMVLSSFESGWDSENELCDLYFVDLLKHRDVSNEIAAITGIFHQSPQAIVVKGKEIIYDATHSAIDARKVTSLLKKA
ncbi:MAG: bacillithiol system redox-active protein YtxJ [Crocinitomicaceae bacterium]|nr:bacillithiol system redox-active protein YtxJ [Crocinitomicaceae bacterium]